MSPFVSLWQRAWRRQAGPQSSARPSSDPALLASGGGPPSRTAARSTGPSTQGGAVEPVSAESWWSHAPVALQEAGERPPKGPRPHRLAHAWVPGPTSPETHFAEVGCPPGLERPCGHLLHLQADGLGGRGADEGTGPGPFALSEAQKGGDNARPPKGATNGLEWGVGLGWCPARGLFWTRRCL